MIAAQFPTSADIYLELNGKKMAVVQSYSVTTTKTSSVVEAFGESEPVATIPGPKKHTLVLTRLYATEEAAKEGMNFHDLEPAAVVRLGGAGVPPGGRGAGKGGEGRSPLRQCLSAGSGP